MTASFLVCHDILNMSLPKCVRERGTRTLKYLKQRGSPRPVSTPSSQLPVRRLTGWNMALLLCLSVLNPCNYGMSIWVQGTGVQQPNPRPSPSPPPPPCPVPLVLCKLQSPINKPWKWVYSCSSAPQAHMLLSWFVLPWLPIQTTCTAIVYQPLSWAYKMYIAVTSCCSDSTPCEQSPLNSTSRMRACVCMCAGACALSARSLTAYQIICKFCEGDPLFSRQRYCLSLEQI